jgi:hypothetical protein
MPKEIRPGRIVSKREVIDPRFEMAIERFDVSLRQVFILEPSPDRAYESFHRALARREGGIKRVGRDRKKTAPAGIDGDQAIDLSRKMTGNFVPNRCATLIRFVVARPRSRGKSFGRVFTGLQEPPRLSALQAQLPWNGLKSCPSSPKMPTH